MNTMNYFHRKPLSFFLIVSSIVTGFVFGSCRQDTTDSISLKGTWRFQIDRDDTGEAQHWYSILLADSVTLPGSMATNRKGDSITISTPWTGQIVDSSWFTSQEYAPYRQPGNIKVPFWLQPVTYYKGPAWYQKEIEIPAAWKEKTIELYLERCHWYSKVWIDSTEVGTANSLSTPHTFLLPASIKPGKHLLSIRIDNRINEIDVGQNSHSISDHTQTNWNGITGKLELIARPKISLGDVKIYPDIASKQIRVIVAIRNHTGENASCNLSLQAIPEKNNNAPASKKIRIQKKCDSTCTIAEVTLPMGSDPALWDEFHPNLYSLQVVLTSDKGKDTKRELFGMREWATQGTQFMLNGRPVFLRGTLECAIFPETGFPPTDTGAWMRIFRIARAHGLNHMRFHSWCPPEAAFIAADRSGFYLHVECASWANQGSSIGDGKPIDTYLYEESNRIVDAYGNHPSFSFLLYGNEPAGEHQDQWLTGFVTYWKKKDPRRLYSSGAGWPLLEVTDFNSTAEPRIQGWGQGLASIINALPPQTAYDWENIIARYNKPTVSHEIGQWCVYPDFKEIDQYKGVLKARNFEIFRDRLNAHGMGHLADSFLLASGKLQVLCYKADIEAALRTKGFGGFQLLDLHDFPGQGTALVGVLNAFWNEKGYVKPEEYRRFCNSTVPLLRLSKMIFTNDETLHAEAEIAHFGDKELKGVIPEWTLSSMEGEIIARGKFPAMNIPLGNGIRLGTIDQPLSMISKPSQLVLTLKTDAYENAWNIWVYPAHLPALNDSVLIAQRLDKKTIDYLTRGGRVLLTVRKGSIAPHAGGNIAVGFSSIFWNTAWTGKQPPHTLGILCNPKHPALENFPTEYHSNWQWWDAMSHANAIDVSGIEKNVDPVVRIIDDWFTARPLMLIFEARVGKGKIIVTGADLLTDAENRPEARQLLYSLRKYAAGNQFNPRSTIPVEKLKPLFRD